MAFSRATHVVHHTKSIVPALIDFIVVCSPLQVECRLCAYMYGGFTTRCLYQQLSSTAQTRQYDAPAIIDITSPATWFQCLYDTTRQASSNEVNQFARAAVVLHALPAVLSIFQLLCLMPGIKAHNLADALLVSAISVDREAVNS